MRSWDAYPYGVAPALSDGVAGGAWGRGEAGGSGGEERGSGRRRAEEARRVPAAAGRGGGAGGKRRRGEGSHGGRRGRFGGFSLIFSATHHPSPLVIDGATLPAGRQGVMD